MSQFPPPPPYGQSSLYGAAPFWAPPPDPIGNLIAPARRAAVLQWILGVLMLLLGGCFGIAGVVLPNMRNQPELESTLSKVESQIGISAATTWAFGLAVAAMSRKVGIAVAVVAVAYIVLAFFTRRGGLGAVITSIVLTSLVLLYMLGNALVSLFTPGGIPGACMSFCVTAVHVLLLVWLIQAARSASRVRAVMMMQGSHSPLPQQGQPPMQYAQPGAAWLGPAYGQQSVYGYATQPQQPFPQQAPPAPNSPPAGPETPTAPPPSSNE